MRNTASCISPDRKNIKQPLLLKSNSPVHCNNRDTTLYELEDKFYACDESCSVSCNKTNYKDLIKMENEEIKSLVDNDYSMKSIIVCSITIIISTFQYGFYRDFSNNIYNSNSNVFSSSNTQNNFNGFLFEICFFAWRYQIIFIMLMLYIFLSKYLITRSYIEENRNVNFDIKKEFNKIHMINVNFFELVNLNFLRIAFFNLLPSFFILISTKVLPIGICLIFNNSAVISNFIFQHDKKQRKTLFKVLLFLTIAFILLILFMNYDNGVNKMFFNLDKKEIIDSNNFNTFFYMLAIIACTSGSLISFYFNKKETNNIFTIYSPIEISLIYNINSMIITSSLFLILEFLKTGGLSLKIIYWLIDYELSFYLVIVLGLMGVLNIIFSLFSSIYLKSYFLKMYKIFEIPISDIIAIFILQLYNLPQGFIYYIIIFNFLIALGLVEFA